MSLSSLGVRKKILLMSAAVLSVCLTSLALAKPPLPPPVPPSNGTIFYWDQSTPYDLWAMRADGSNKLILPRADFWNARDRAPSRLVYGANPSLDRIWLTFADPVNMAPELYAYKFVDVGGTLVVKTCRITKLYPGFDANNNSDSSPAWSNGGDSFVSFPAWQNGSSQIVLLRAWVTGAEIDAAIAAGTNIDLDATAFGTGKLEVVASSNTVNSTFRMHTWSPDGTRLAYVLYNWSGASGVYQCSVRTLATGAEIQLPNTNRISWSPDGTRLAYAGIWTVNPDGTGLARPYGPGRDAGDVYFNPFWSPDSQQLVFQRQQFARNRWTRNIERGLATGGSTEILTGDRPAADEKVPIAWVPTP